MKDLWKSGLIFLIFLITTAGCAHRMGKEALAVSSGEDRIYEVIVSQVVMDYVDGEGIIPVIILANKENGEEILPIWVDMPEGMSINMALNKHIGPRPGTHDLFASVLGQFDIELVKVVITDLRKQTYIASMTVKSRGETREIDARPSDAIALALRSVAPVFVSEKVIHKSGWSKVQKRSEKRKKVKREGDML
jgi:bifunctional DNase/RNase